MARAVFTTPCGHTITSNWGNQPTAGEAMAMAIAAIAEGIRDLGGVWVGADNMNGPATAFYLPIGTTIVAEFDSGLVPQSVLSTAITLGEVG